MTEVETQVRIVDENFTVKRCKQKRYMIYHGHTTEDLYLLACNALLTGTNVLSFR
jgi:hypothetical protein